MTLGTYHPYTIHTLWNLGLAYQAAREPEKALAMFQQAAAGLEKLDLHPCGSPSNHRLEPVCNGLEQREQYDRADVWRRQWLAAARKSNGSDSAAYAMELIVQGEDLLRCERYVTAEPYLRDSVAILQNKQARGLGDCLPRHNRCSAAFAARARETMPEAEPLLVQGYEGLKAPCGSAFAAIRSGSECRGEAGERIVRLYEALGPGGEGRRMASRAKLPHDRSRRAHAALNIPFKNPEFRSPG